MAGSGQAGGLGGRVQILPSKEGCGRPGTEDGDSGGPFRFACRGTLKAIKLRV